LLAEVIDYAGLFPPAKLPLEAAWAGFVEHRSDPAAWMLSHFVIPAAKLAELEPLLERTPTPAQRPWSFSVLAGGGADEAEFRRLIAADAERLQGFERRSGARAFVPALEVKLPASTRGGDRAEVWIDLVTKAFALPTIPPAYSRTIYFEGTLGADPAREIEHLAESLSAHRELRDAHEARSAERQPAEPIRPSVGFKLRTGGLEPAAFPSPELVATAIVACRDRGINWKATAGLHHPFRRWDAGVNARMHGFLNLLAAVAAAHLLELEGPDLVGILADENPAGLRFSDSGLTVAGRTIPADRLGAIRLAGFQSFGSCSFVEPRDDLATLGLLS
jgi:hypothetical protein